MNRANNIQRRRNAGKFKKIVITGVAGSLESMAETLVNTSETEFAAIENSVGEKIVRYKNGCPDDDKPDLSTGGRHDKLHHHQSQDEDDQPEYAGDGPEDGQDASQAEYCEKDEDEVGTGCVAGNGETQGELDPFTCTARESLCGRASGVARRMTRQTARRILRLGEPGEAGSFEEIYSISGSQPRSEIGNVHNILYQVALKRDYLSNRKPCHCYVSVNQNVKP